jgi:hypothetical protein
MPTVTHRIVKVTRVPFTPATILCGIAKAFGAALVGVCCWFVSRISGYL